MWSISCIIVLDRPLHDCSLDGLQTAIFEGLREAQRLVRLESQKRRRKRSIAPSSKSSKKAGLVTTTMAIDSVNKHGAVDACQRRKREGAERMSRLVKSEDTLVMPPAVLICFAEAFLIREVGPLWFFRKTRMPPRLR